MDFEEYQAAAKQFAAYEEDVYPLLGLAEETGEFLSLFAKVYRGDDLVARYGTVEAFREMAAKEAGDVLWMLAECLGSMGLSLQDVAELNLKKLTDRKERGVIRGVGDER